MKQLKIYMFFTALVFFVILFSRCERVFDKVEQELKKAKDIPQTETVTAIEGNVYKTEKSPLRHGWQNI